MAPTTETTNNTKPSHPSSEVLHHLPHEALRIVVAHVRALGKTGGDFMTAPALPGRGEALIRVLSVRVIAGPVWPGPGKRSAPTETADISPPMSRAEIAEHYRFATPLLRAAGGADLRLIVLLQLAGQNYCTGFCSLARDIKRQNSAAAPPSRFKERRTAVTQDVRRPHAEKRQ